MSGMTAGQIPIAASPTSVTSSIATTALPYLPIGGGTLSGPVTLSSAVFAETDYNNTAAPVAAGGWWRWGVGAGGNFALHLNTAAAGNFSTFNSLIVAAPTGAISLSGPVTISSTLAVGGNGNPTLSIFSGSYTALNAPDGVSGGAGLYLGNAANAFNLHRQSTHQFQDRAAAATFCTFSSTGTANVSGAWTVISDPSVKQDLAPYTRGLDAIVRLTPVEFRYRAGVHGEEASRPLFGLMADEVKPIVPEIVGSTTATIAGKDGVTLDTLEPGNLIYALINSCKELASRVAALEARGPA